MSALSPSNVWVAGVGRTDPKTDAVAHWDGSTWSTLQLPVPSVTISALQMVSPTSGWAVGESIADNDLNGATVNDGYVFHFDGTAWRVWLTMTGQLWDIASSSAPEGANVWAAGFETFFGVVGPEGPGITLASLAEHWDGIDPGRPGSNLARWHFAPMIQNKDFSAVATMSPTQTWFTNGGTSLYRWDGSNWRVETFPFDVYGVSRVGQTNQLWLTARNATTGQNFMLLGTCA